MRRIKIFMLSAVLALFAGAVSAQNYKLVWSDEFDSNTLGKNWTVETNATPSNNELQYYGTENVTIANGNLVITARKENKEGKSFTSGRVNSKGLVNFKRGKIVARIKMPNLNKGLWPAFWMMGENFSWPKCGEIDIMEAGHKDAITAGTVEKQIAGALHWGNSISEHQQTTFAPYTSSSVVTGDYHLFTCQWDENSIKCYLDDATEPYFSKNIAEMGAYFDQQFYILFNMAVGGDYTNILSASGITALESEAKMYVDYVRVYQLEGDATENIVFPSAYEIPAAPVPTRNAADVMSFFSDTYTTVTGCTPILDMWGCEGQSASEIYVGENDKVIKIVNPGWMGFIYNSYVNVDMTSMTHLHLDIYTDVNYTAEIGIGTDNGKGAADEYAAHLDMVSGWNAIDISLADAKTANPALDFTKHKQLKIAGSNSSKLIYVDNIYFYKPSSAGVESVEVEENASNGKWYTISGTELSGKPSQNGLYIHNGKKLIINNF